jgi:hypothetical protein
MQTDWCSHIPPDGPSVEPRLWVGRDQHGNPVQCWIPEKIPAEVREAGMQQFTSHRPAQAKRARPKPSGRVIRTNKQRGR